MDGDYLKGALFENGKRLSSGRHVKPKRNFSPEHETPTQRKNVTKKTNEVSETDYVDCMYRSSLIQQVSKIPLCVFRLPLNVFIVSKDKKLQKTQKTIPNKLDDSHCLSLFSEFGDFIDHEALANVAKLEKEFEVLKFFI